MMGHQPPPQPSLFYTGINLEKRIRADHVLRKVARMVDFDFVYQESQGSIWIQRQRIGCTANDIKADDAFGAVQRS